MKTNRLLLNKKTLKRLWNGTSILLILAVLAGSLPMALAPTPAYAQTITLQGAAGGVAAVQPAVTLYENENFGGLVLLFDGTPGKTREVPDLNAFFAVHHEHEVCFIVCWTEGEDHYWGDVPSSLKVKTGWKVTLYEAVNFGGGSRSFEGPEDAATLPGFSDVASSLKIEDTRPVPAVPGSMEIDTPNAVSGNVYVAANQTARNANDKIGKTSFEMRNTSPAGAAAINWSLSVPAGNDWAEFAPTDGTLGVGGKVTVKVKYQPPAENNSVPVTITTDVGTANFNLVVGAWPIPSAPTFASPAYGSNGRVNVAEDKKVKFKVNNTFCCTDKFKWVTPDRIVTTGSAKPEADLSFSQLGNTEVFIYIVDGAPVEGNPLVIPVTVWKIPTVDEKGSGGSWLDGKYVGVVGQAVTLQATGQTGTTGQGESISKFYWDLDNDWATVEKTQTPGQSETYAWSKPNLAGRVRAKAETNYGIVSDERLFDLKVYDVVQADTGGPYGGRPLKEVDLKGSYNQTAFPGGSVVYQWEVNDGGWRNVSTDERGAAKYTWSSTGAFQARFTATATTSEVLVISGNDTTDVVIEASKPTAMPGGPYQGGIQGGNFSPVQLSGNPPDFVEAEDIGKITEWQWFFSDGANKAIELDGVNDYVELGSPSALMRTGNQSYEFWLRPKKLGKQEFIYLKARAGEGAIVLETDGRVTYNFGSSGNNTGGYQTFTMTSPVGVNTWTHLAVVRDGNTLKWYKNGSLTNTSTHSYENGASSVLSATMGKGDGSVSYYLGAIDDFAVWDRALTEAEVLQHMSTGLKGTEKGLVGYWPFENGEGNTARDMSSNKNNGTLVNAAASAWVDNGHPIYVQGVWNPSYAFPKVGRYEATLLVKSQYGKWSVRKTAAVQVIDGTIAGYVKAADLRTPVQDARITISSDHVDKGVLASIAAATSFLGGASDTSDANFAITSSESDPGTPPNPSGPAELTVVSPNGGEKWAKGTTQTIRWSSSRLNTGLVKVEVSRDGGQSWTAIARMTPNDGEFEWSVSGTPTGQARVRVSEDPKLQRNSDGSLWTLTNAAGYYAFEHLPLGTYRVAAYKRNGDLHEFEVPLKVTELTLKAPNQLAVDFVDISVFPVGGRVIYSLQKDGADVLVDNVTVEAFPIASASGVKSQPSTSSLTATGVNWSVPLFAGKYLFLGSRPGHDIRVKEGIPGYDANTGLVVIEGARTNVDFIDWTTRKLTVYVVDSGGYPMPGREVIIIGLNGSARGPSDASEGKFEATLNPGKYTVHVEGAMPKGERVEKDAEVDLTTGDTTQTMVIPVKIELQIGPEPNLLEYNGEAAKFLKSMGLTDEQVQELKAGLDGYMFYWPPEPRTHTYTIVATANGHPVEDFNLVVTDEVSQMTPDPPLERQPRLSDGDRVKYAVTAGLPKLDRSVTPPLAAAKWVRFWAAKDGYKDSDLYQEDVTILGDVPVGTAARLVPVPVVNYGVLHDPPGDGSSAYLDDSMSLSGIIAGMSMWLGDKDVPVYPSPWTSERVFRGINDPITQLERLVLEGLIASLEGLIASLEAGGVTVEQVVATLRPLVTVSSVIPAISSQLESVVSSLEAGTLALSDVASRLRSLVQKMGGFPEDLGTKGLLGAEDAIGAYPAFAIAYLIESVAGGITALLGPLAAPIQLIRVPVQAGVLEAGMELGIPGIPGVQYEVSPSRHYETPSGDSLPDLLGPGKGDIYFGEGWTLGLQTKYRLGVDLTPTGQVVLHTQEIETYDILEQKNQYVKTLRDIEIEMAALERAKQNATNEAEKARLENALKTWKKLLSKNLALTWIKDGYRDYLSQGKGLEEFAKDNSLEGGETLIVSGGATFSYSRSISQSISTTFSTSMGATTAGKLAAGLKTKAGFEWLGSGFAYEIDLPGEIAWSTGVAFGTGLTGGKATGQTVGFTLSDDDVGDNYAVRVYTDPVWGTPLFFTEPGSVSSDPWEWQQDAESGTKWGTNRAVDLEMTLESQATGVFDYSEGAHYKIRTQFSGQRALQGGGSTDFFIYALTAGNADSLTARFNGDENMYRVKFDPVGLPMANIAIDLYPSEADKQRHEEKQYQVTIVMESEGDQHINRVLVLNPTFADLKAPRAVISTPYEGQRISPVYFPEGNAFEVLAVSEDTDLDSIQLQIRSKRPDGVWEPWSNLPGMLWKDGEENPNVTVFDRLDRRPARREFTFKWPESAIRPFGEAEYALRAIAVDKATQPNTDIDPPSVTFRIDGTRPSVLNTVPDYQAKDADRIYVSELSATFTDDMRAGDFTDRTFYVTDLLNNNAQVAGYVSYNPALRKTVFVPIVPFKANGFYRVVVKTDSVKADGSIDRGVHDLAGNPLDNLMMWTFRTKGTVLEPAWSVILSATQGSVTDGNNIAGVEFGALDTEDGKDVREVPSLMDRLLGRSDRLRLGFLDRKGVAFDRDIRPADGRLSHHWSFVVKNAAPGAPVTINWTPSTYLGRSTRDYQVLRLVELDSNGNVSNTIPLNPSDAVLDMSTGLYQPLVAYTYTPAAGETARYFRLDVQKTEMVLGDFRKGTSGWMFFSVPVTPQIADPFVNLGDDIDPFKLWWYDTELGGYKIYPIDLGEVSLRPGRGYFTYLEKDAVVDIGGAVNREDVELELKAPGFHAIGNPFLLPVNIQDLKVTKQNGESIDEKPFNEAVTDGWVSGTLYRWKLSISPGDPVDADVPVSTGALQPWKGYWLETRVPDITLTIPAPQDGSFPQDKEPPTSTVISANTNSPTVTVRWAGSDDLSGVRWYDVQVKDGARGQWGNWLVGTTSTSAVYPGEYGRTYYFRSRAQDNAGNWEDYSGLDGDLSITPKPNGPVAAGASNGAAPSLAVASPNGGEELVIGSRVEITWISGTSDGRVRIELSQDGGRRWTRLTSRAPNSGSYIWTVKGPATSEARIRVTSTARRGPSDSSDANFTISTGDPVVSLGANGGGPSLTVTSPNAGETWAVGSRQEITWSSSETRGSVRIEVSRDGGQTWKRIASRTRDDGSHTWKVSGPATDQARIRVTSTSRDGPSDVSDVSFKIR